MALQPNEWLVDRMLQLLVAQPLSNRPELAIRPLRCLPSQVCIVWLTLVLYVAWKRAGACGSDQIPSIRMALAVAVLVRLSLGDPSISHRNTRAV